MECLPLFEAKNHLTKLVHAAEQGEIIELTRHGKPAAVLMGVLQYQKLNEGQSGFSARLTRFLEENPGATEPDDPFENVRQRDGGRIVEL